MQVPGLKAYPGFALLLAETLADGFEVLLDGHRIVLGSRVKMRSVFKFYSKSFRMAHKISSERLEYIKKHVVNSKIAALLIGHNAAHELRCLYQNLSELECKGLIELKENEIEFWTGFLKFIKGEHPSKYDLDRDEAVTLVGGSLKRLGRPYHLFLPDVDEMFYQYDIKQKGYMGASLRRLWSDHTINLTIFGSVSDTQARSYKKTINLYDYPLWINNWLHIFI